MSIEQIIKKYATDYAGCTYSYIANKIQEEQSTGLSHRTLRKRVGQFYPAVEVESKGNVITELAYPAKQDWPLGLRRPVHVTKPKQIQPYLGGNPKNVLVIGDTQFPFHREGYLEHCRAVQERFNCGSVVHIGDVADNHYSSFHETNPDGFGAGEELDRVITQTKLWSSVFPEAKVTIGNHDAIINRQAVKAGISSRWIKGLAEVFETPNWEYDTEFVFNGTMYTHTLGSNVLQAALLRQVNLVVGHEHSQAKIEYAASLDKLFWAMKVGAGVDDRKYAFNYAKTAPKKSIMSCGVVEDKIPFIIPMSL